MSTTFEGDILKLNFAGHEYFANEPFTFTCSYETKSRIQFLEPYTGDVFLDVGACVGSWSIPASFNFKQVYAFEPNEEALVFLRTHIGMNKVKNIKIVESLISSEDAPPLNYDGWQIYPGPGATPSVTIDAFRESNKLKVDYIKIDVEGHELEVLSGARQTLKQDRPRVMVEIHCFLGISMNDVFALMLKANEDYIGKVLWNSGNYCHVLFEVL